MLAASHRLAAAGRFRYLATSANGQPAAASYLRTDGEEVFRPMGIDVLRIEDGLVAEVTVSCARTSSRSSACLRACDNDRRETKEEIRWRR